MPPKSSCELPRTSSGRPARSALKRSKRRSSSGSTLYFRASSRKSCCSSASFSGCSAARSCACVQSSGAVELPDVVVERRHLRVAFHGMLWRVTRSPALVVDAAVAEHLEVLRRPALSFTGVVERVRHGDTVHRHAARRRRRTSGAASPAASSTVGATSITWWNCERTSPLALKPLGQCTIVPLRTPPQCDAICFVHWYGVSIACAQPTA